MTEIKALCVFCGSKMGASPQYQAVAKQLGSLLAERSIRLIYGGGNIGLMGVVADAVMDAGGEVTGVIPEFLMKFEVGKSNVNELIVVESMHERKSRMFELSDGVVLRSLPGNSSVNTISPSLCSVLMTIGHRSRIWSKVSSIKILPTRLLPISIRLFIQPKPYFRPYNRPPSPTKRS
jgi:uncharacterized protein (TIGR00730 family)